YYFSEVERTGYGATVTSYDVKFTPFRDMPFIAKADRVTRPEGTIRARRRVIQSVERMPTVATQCIAVDSPDQTYLAGEGMIPTHNSGERALQYPHSVAIQLALYANAPWLAGAWEGESGETEDFEQLPAELDREIGLVLHMPEPGRVALGEVNIAAGWAIARDAIFPILDWRDRDDLVTVIDLALPSSTPDDPFDGVSGNGPLIAGMSSQRPTAVPSPPAVPAGPSAAGEGTASPAPAALPRVEWIAARIAQLPPAGLQL